MDIQREKEFVSQYHYDARNFEWEKENGPFGVLIGLPLT